MGPPLTVVHGGVCPDDVALDDPVAPNEAAAVIWQCDVPLDGVPFDQPVTLVKSTPARGFGYIPIVRDQVSTDGSIAVRQARTPPLVDLVAYHPVILNGRVRAAPPRASEKTAPAPSSPVWDGEALEGAGFVLRTGERDDRAGLGTIDGGVRDHRGVERVRARESNVLAKQADVFNVCAFGHNDRVAVGSRVNSFLDGFKGALPCRTVAAGLDGAVNVPDGCEGWTGACNERNEK